MVTISAMLDAALREHLRLIKRVLIDPSSVWYLCKALFTYIHNPYPALGGGWLFESVYGL